MESPERYDSSPNPADLFPVFLSEPTPDCEEEFIAASRRSETLHRPWAFPPATSEQYAGYLEKIRSGCTIPFLVRIRADHRLAGVVNVSEPVMGVFQSAYLGFYAFDGAERRGYMTAGLALVLDRAFREHGFHRLEANVQPANLASSALVRRLGFRREGFSPHYLFIDGAWRDHDRWAILAEEWSEIRSKFLPR